MSAGAKTIAFTVHGEPKSKARPRFNFSGGGAYTDAPTVKAERMVAQAYDAVAGDYVADNTGRSTYKVSVVFYAFTRQRRDVDNMLKLVLDALNKRAWADDCYVESVYGEKRYVATREEARTEVTIEVVADGILGSHVAEICQQCGRDMWVSPSQRGSIKFCSKECREAGYVGKTTVPCRNCGTNVERWPAALKRTGGVAYCGKECRGAYLTGKKRGS